MNHKIKNKFTGKISFFNITDPLQNLTGLWFIRFFLQISWKKRSSHQGKKRSTCIPYCVQTSSFLFVGMWRVCKSSKINIQEVQGALSSRPRPATHFSGFIIFEYLKKINKKYKKCSRFLSYKKVRLITCTCGISTNRAHYYEEY